MKINKEFEITTDKDKNYVLMQTYKTKVGTYTTKERYYPTLEKALDDCLKLGILQTELKDLKTVLDTLNKLEKDIKKSLKEVKWYEKKM